MEDQNPPKAPESLATKFYKLAEGLVWRFSEGSQKEEPPSTLDQQELPKDLQGLSRVASQLLSSNQEVQRVARICVAQILKSLPASDAWWFSSNILGYVSQSWHLMKADQVEAIAGAPSDDAYPWVLGLLSRQDSGYVRHKAVQLLANIHDGRELPFLLVRQNDWVEAVAQEAQLAVKQRIHDQYAVHLATYLPVIAHLSVCSRHNHSPLVQQVFTLLVDDKYTSLLEQIFATASRPQQRFLMQQCVSISGSHQVRFLEACLTSSDPVICSAGCRLACRVYSEEKLYSYLECLTKHRFVVVRKMAMQEIARLFATRDPAFWRRSLLDSNQGIRELARYWTMQLGMTAQEIHEVYQSHLDSSVYSLVALQGLQEVGHEEDAITFQPYLKHPSPAFRQAAVRGFCKFPTEAILEPVIGMLWDSSPTVVQEVGKALLPIASLLDPYYLCGVAVSGPHKKGRNEAIKLLAAQGKWKSIPFLLRVAAEGSAEVASQAEEAIEIRLGFRRIQTSFMPPQAPDRQSIVKALEEYQTRVTPAVVAMVMEAIEIA